MKTNLLKLVKVVALAAMTMMLANCSKDSGSSSNGAVAGYGLNQYGQCVQLTTGQIAPNTNYCGTNTGYSYNSAGQCIQTSTGQIVATNYCTNVNNGGYTTQLCSGTYYYNQGYGLQAISCYPTYQYGNTQSSNCSGYYLSPNQNLTTWIRCQ